jgi:hypothetical protein
MKNSILSENNAHDLAYWCGMNYEPGSVEAPASVEDAVVALVCAVPDDIYGYLDELRFQMIEVFDLVCPELVCAGILAAKCELGLRVFGAIAFEVAQSTGTKNWAAAAENVSGWAATREPIDFPHHPLRFKDDEILLRFGVHCAERESPTSRHHVRSRQALLAHHPLYKRSLNKVS